jgi:hypothetical protein
METYQTAHVALQQSGLPPDMLYILGMSIKLDATDPHNKVFGLLAITNHVVVADYALSAVDIYTNFA